METDHTFSIQRSQSKQRIQNQLAEEVKTLQSRLILRTKNLIIENKEGDQQMPLLATQELWVHKTIVEPLNLKLQHKKSLKVQEAR